MLHTYPIKRRIHVVTLLCTNELTGADAKDSQRIASFHKHHRIGLDTPCTHA